LVTPGAFPDTHANGAIVDSQCTGELNAELQVERTVNWIDWVNEPELCNLPDESVLGPNGPT